MLLLGSLAPVGRFALRNLLRDWRAGDLRVLAAALVIAVASVTSVGFFVDRVQRALAQQAGELLAADLVVAASSPPAQAHEEEARRRGLATARLLTFPSMASFGEELHLAEVKAVSAGYPLRGALRVTSAPFAPDTPADAGPVPGTAWLDPRLLGSLGARVGDSVSLGYLNLRITQVLSYEPDRGGDFFSLGPRLLMHMDDMEASGLIQPGSRVRHRLLVAGAADAVADYTRWLRPRLAAGESLQDLREARPELSAALDRAERFLGLAALTAVLLAGMAVAVAARRFARRHVQPTAVLRCLGARQRFILGVYVLQLVLLALAASVVGSALGFLAQAGLASSLGGLLPVSLPAPGALPLLTGAATAVVTLLGFALPPLIGLQDIPPAQVLQRQRVQVPVRAWLTYGAAALALSVLVIQQARNLQLALHVLAGTLATLLILAPGAMLLVRTLAPLRTRVGVAWRFGLAGIARRAGGSVTQILAFGLSIMILLLLTLVRTELLETWRDRLPADAPNYFLINIQADEVPALRDFLARTEIPEAELYPMVRGRLTAIEGRPVAADDFANPRAQRLLEREFNLSWAERPSPDNRIVAGQWWADPALDPATLSVEVGLADLLGLRLGDELRFEVAGRPVQARITNLRSVEWDSFRVNFFVIAPPALLDALPATYITSFHLPTERYRVLGELVREFPSVTVIDVDALMRKVRSIMDQAVVAVQYVFLFALVAGFTVLAAAIQSSLDERLRESAIVRTLGGRRRQVLGALAAELTALGALAGFLGALAAMLVGGILAGRVFEIDYGPDPGLLLTGILAGIVCVAGAGLLGSWHIIGHPPMESLRGRET